MTRSDWTRLRALFEGTLACPPERRAAYLDEHVNGDDGLQREVESLLAAHEAAGGFLGAAPVQIDAHDVTGRLTTNMSRLAANRLASGSHLGPFEILEPIGAGGMGEVYRARDTRLDRFVAIKVLSPDLDVARGGPQRFEREARAISRLSHPHICTIHDIGSAQFDGGEVPFLVMELLDGETLAARLSRGPLPLDEALTFAIAIADALAAAHRQGVVHRDLKPANVMVTSSGVKLLDFGLAQLRGTADHGVAGAGDGSLTSTGMVFGTVPYMAPEQLRGEEADVRTDVFACGALLHEMLTGRRPFTADSQAGLIAAILEHDTPPVSERQPRATAQLDHIVLKCLAKDPSHRWQTASELRGELQRTIDEIRGAKPAASKQAARMTAAALAVLAGAIWALWPARDAGRPEPSLGPLTAFHGDEGYPALSPDGTQVAFAWNGERRDNADIYIKRIDADDTPLRLTTDPADDIAPAWSPDGSRIAFIRGAGEQASIYVTAPVPGAERKLVDYAPSSVSYPSFSTRNHSVAWSHDSRWVIVAARIPAERPNAILAVPVGGGEPLVVFSVDADEGDYRFPTVSPDGSSLAYAFCRGGGCDVFVTTLGADMISRGAPRRLTRQSAALIYGIAWAADGRSLVYGSWIGTLNLWRVSTSGAEPKRLELGLGGLRPDVSRAGNRLAYARLGADSDIWKFEGGAGPVPVASSTLLDIDADLSPDGRRIALASERSGRSRDIWIVNPDGTGAMRLTDEPGTARWKGTPRWSPDGRWIAYDAREEHGRFSIHVIDAAGGSPRQLTADGIVPSWSRDGAWIYFGSSRSGTDQIWRVPASGGDAEQVTDNGGHTAWESWDGTLVYYNRGGGLYARPVTGGAEQEVLPPTTGVGRNFFPAAGGIYYAVRPDDARPNAYEIRFLGFATGTSETLYRFESLGLSQGLSVSADGKTIIFSGVSPSKNSDLMLVQNFR